MRSEKKQKYSENQFDAIQRQIDASQHQTNDLRSTSRITIRYLTKLYRGAQKKEINQCHLITAKSFSCY